MNVFKAQIVVLILAILLIPQSIATAQGYSIEVETISSGYAGKMCWVYPRAGTIPDENPLVVLTM